MRDVVVENEVGDGHFTVDIQFRWGEVRWLWRNTIFKV
jgi:hypothetical protein